MFSIGYVLSSALHAIFGTLQPLEPLYAGPRVLIQPADQPINLHLAQRAKWSDTSGIADNSFLNGVLCTCSY